MEQIPLPLKFKDKEEEKDHTITFRWEEYGWVTIDSCTSNCYHYEYTGDQD